MFAIAVAIVSVGLIGFGLQDLLSAHSPLGLVVILIACYGIYQVVRTPLALRLGDDGVLRLTALGGGAVPAADLERVQLIRAGTLRPDSFRFIRRDGSVAFSTDAAAWDVAKLRELLLSIRVQIEVPSATR